VDGELDIALEIVLGFGSRVASAVVFLKHCRAKENGREVGVDWRSFFNLTCVKMLVKVHRYFF
jgi:hypothetical protein